MSIKYPISRKAQRTMQLTNDHELRQTGSFFKNRTTRFCNMWQCEIFFASHFAVVYKVAHGGFEVNTNVTASVGGCGLKELESGQICLLYSGN